MGGAYASGDEQGDVYTQFDPVAPDVQGPFGVMDVFALSNLVEGHAAVGATLADDCQLTLRYGYARMADRRGEWLNAYLMPIGRVPMGGENTSPSDGELGHEMALAFQWALRPAFSLRAAYGLLLQGQGARAILASSQRTPLGDDGQPAGGASFSHGGYLQGLVRFP
jgi:hypothetical protein